MPSPPAIGAEFLAGHVYNLDTVSAMVAPCPAKKFLRELGVKPLAGIVTGDEILQAMATRATRLQALTASDAPRARGRAPKNALKPIGAKDVIAMRQRRQ